MKELKVYTAELRARIDEQTAQREDLRRRVGATILTVLPLTLLLVFGLVRVLPRRQAPQQTTTAVETAAPAAAPTETVAAAPMTATDAPADAQTEAGLTETQTEEADPMEAPEEPYEASEAGIPEDIGTAIPPLPATNAVVVTGELLTDAEARAYLAEHLDGYTEALSRIETLTGALRVEDSSYFHLCYGEGENQYLELRQNFRDYLLYSGDRLAAIVSLEKENGVIYDTVSGGSEWYAEYDAFLKAHKGERLLSVFAGMHEFILAPDGAMFSLLGQFAPICLQDLEDPYAWFSEHLP